MREIKWNFWLRQAAAVLGYAALYLAVRPLSDGVWAVTAGLRLSALFFFPYRYWPALVLGESALLAYMFLPCLAPFGTTWVVLSSISPMLYAMPIVWFFRARLNMFPSKRTIALKPLIGCVLSVSVVWSLIVATITTTALIKSPFSIVNMIGAGVLGKYTGILTILPLVLMVRLDTRPFAEQLHWRSFFKSSLALDICLVLVPSLLCLSWLAHHASVDALQVLRISMFVPVAWLTIKHGWRAAAVGTSVVMACIFLNVAVRADTDVIQIQAFIAFVSTALLALGAIITTQQEKEDSDRVYAKQVVKVAQQGMYLSEMRMRQTAQALEQVGGALQLTHAQLLNRFKHMLPVSESQSFHRQATATRNQLYQLAESMHPVAWRDKGLPAALRETIARTLDEAGVTYHCDLERRLSDISPSVHVAIYRLICEATVYACDLHHCSRVHVRLRGGSMWGKKWAVMRVTGEFQSHQTSVNDSVYQTDGRRALARKLGAHGLDVEAMRDFVRIYGGELHVRTTPEHVRITALLNDVEMGRQHIDPTAPKKLFLR